MCRWSGAILSWLIALALGWAGAPQVQARAAVLMDAETGQVLFAKNAHKPLPPASITKIMTAILVLERCDLDAVVKASERAVNTKASSMHLRVGEEVKVRDLLYALMLRSANDAAVALAEHTAGSVEAFAALMNEKAKSLGAKHTHFVNPHGLARPTPPLHRLRPRAHHPLRDAERDLPRHRESALLHRSRAPSTKTTCGW
jgi:D-alanyl-D-alanine carboxypeptidase (penicillin-binding protein 5/6)